MQNELKSIAPGAVARARTLNVLALAGWFVTACVAGARGRLARRVARAPFVLLAFLAVPTAGFVVAYRASPAFRVLLNRVSLTQLVGAHAWRFVGLGFVRGWQKGALPAGFAIPEGFGDILAASGALALVPMLRKGTARREWLLVWNVFGLLDLVSAITLGVLYSEGPLGRLRRNVSTRPMVTFPVSLIPTFFVPLFMLFHALTFKRIAELPARVGVGCLPASRRPMRGGLSAELQIR